MNKIEKLRLGFIKRFDRIFKNQFCWADCVSWAFNYRVKDYNPFNIELAKTCREESEKSEVNTCYCGRFYRGLAISELTEAQLEAALNNSLTEREIKNIKIKQEIKARFQERVFFLFILVLFLILGMLTIEAAFVSSINF